MSTFKNILLVLVLHIFPAECSVLYPNAGTDLTIQCVGVPLNSDVKWKFNDNFLVYIDGRSGAKRRGPLYSQGSTKYYPTTNSLKITRLETSDSGRYSCAHGSEYTVHFLHVVSVSVKPGPVLLQSSDAELHCNVGEDPKAEVQWLRPPNAQPYPDRKQIINLKSVTSNDEGQWTCQVQNSQINITLTVVGLKTKESIEVTQGGDVDLPCYLPQLTSWRVVGGKWKADHLPEISSSNLENTDNTLQWKGHNTSKVIFTSGQLSINYTIKLIKVQSSDAGRFDCTVKFDGELILNASTMLRVVSGTSISGNKVVANVNVPTTKRKGLWTKNVLGVPLWIHVAVGASSAVVIGLIILIVFVQRRNKRMKKRVRQQRSIRQPLTTKDYCRCDRSEREEELVKHVRPVPVPRHQRNANNRTQPYN